MPESGNIHWLARKMAVRNSSFQSIPLDRLNRVMNSLEFTILSVLKDRSALEGGENRLYVKDISQWLNVPAARLSPIFTKLEEEGYIRWESDERLGASYVALTDYGKSWKNSRISRYAFTSMSSTVSAERRRESWTGSCWSWRASFGMN